MIKIRPVGTFGSKKNCSWGAHVKSCELDCMIKWCFSQRIGSGKFLRNSGGRSPPHLWCWSWILHSFWIQIRGDLRVVLELILNSSFEFQSNSRFSSSSAPASDDESDQHQHQIWYDMSRLTSHHRRQHHQPRIRVRGQPIELQRSWPWFSFETSGVKIEV